MIIDAMMFPCFCVLLVVIMSPYRKAAEEALDNLTAEATRARLGLSTLEAERSLLEEQVTNAASKVS